MTRSGPAWLGIGAQRSGTTWLTDLLIQHPQVAVPGGQKELHQLYLGLITGWTPERSQEYRALFSTDDPQLKLGEFTPFYLRAPWSISVAKAELADDVPILVILRDPVARYESAVRQGVKRMKRFGQPINSKWMREKGGSDAIWAGFYASQLDGWIAAFGRDRIRVLQYEQTVTQPQETVNAIWGDLGLEPVTLTGVDERSRSSTKASLWALDDDFRSELTTIYRDDARRIIETHGFDGALWPTAR